MQKKVYLAGPISGQSFDGATTWREKFTEHLKGFGVECLDPMRGKHYLSQEEQIKDSYENTLLSNLHAITIRDHNDTKNCDLLIVNFLPAGDKTSIGTCLEIGWANAYRKPIIVIMKKDNVHYHGMIRDICLVVDTEKDALMMAKLMLNVK